ncbi:membrane protein containing DUF502 [Candidatus Omnitrophus magneticus]|uniref:Membrane protein containing DUF502 n=1 Tax=Candidatus Omnitrophus magneticus TaxID=1609969 RepID=A0A0F0CN18_9BACT|nr:membrane protein containing DUF502 [Candidatus Omnitrophus magneticus]
MNKTIWNKFFIGFINGIAILAPVFITIAIVKYFLVKIDSLFLDPFLKIFKYYDFLENHLGVARFIIFVFVITSVSAIGWSARIFIIKRFFMLWEKLFLNVPVLGKIYSTIKQISSAVFGHGKKIFSHVVLVEYPRKGLYSIGFVTGVPVEEIRAVAGEKALSVLVPTPPNPATGMLIFVPRNEVIFLKMSVEDGMKQVISGGAINEQYQE